MKNINLIGLDVTRRVLYNQDIDRVLRQFGEKQKLIADMLSTIGQEDRTDYAFLMKNPLDPVRAIHDAVAVAYLIDATIFKAEKIPLKIDMTHTKGQTLIKEGDCVVNVIRFVNEKSFFEIMYQTLQNV